MTVVLRTVLATPGAEVSASQTRAYEMAAAAGPPRLDAEGAFILRHRR